MFKDGVAKERFRLSELKYENKRGEKGKSGQAYVREKLEYQKTYTEAASKRANTFIRLGEFAYYSKDNLEDREYRLEEFIEIRPIITGRIVQK